MNQNLESSRQRAIAFSILFSANHREGGQGILGVLGRSSELVNHKTTPIVAL